MNETGVTARPARTRRLPVSARAAEGIGAVAAFVIAVAFYGHARSLHVGVSAAAALEGVAFMGPFLAAWALFIIACQGLTIARVESRWSTRLLAGRPRASISVPPFIQPPPASRRAKL